MNRVSSIAFAAAVLSFALVACNKADEAPNANKTATVGSAATTPPAVAATAKAPPEAEHAPVAELSVDEVDALLKSDGCTAVDANSVVTRKKMGTIPNATLLSHYTGFEPSELPADKSRKLVFYCANEFCGASHSAAEEAIVAGYSDVTVLPAGIAGWRKAGKEVATMQ